MFIEIFILVFVIGFIVSMSCDCCKDEKDKEDDNEY